MPRNLMREGDCWQVRKIRNLEKKIVKKQRPQQGIEGKFWQAARKVHLQVNTRNHAEDVNIID